MPESWRNILEQAEPNRSTSLAEKPEALIKQQIKERSLFTKRS